MDILNNTDNDPYKKAKISVLTKSPYIYLRSRDHLKICTYCILGKRLKYLNL